MIRNIFIVLIIAIQQQRVLSSASQNTINNSYTQFRKAAINWGSNRMTNELNRAILHLKNMHGSSFSPEKANLNKLISEMKTKGYLDDNIFIDLSHDPIQWHSGKIVSISYPVTPQLTEALNQSFSDEVLIRALHNNEDSYVKLFALHNIDSQISIQPSQTLLIDGLMQEQDKTILHHYVKILKQESTFNLIRSDVSERSTEDFEARMRRLALSAQSLSEKADALFINTVFTNYLIPDLDTRILMYCMDHSFARNFLLKVFTNYPQTQLEKFIIPFEKGYGNQFLTLLFLFENFHTNSKILNSLKLALINREQGHFNFHQSAILQAWIRISGIPYTGSNAPYLKWIEARLKE